MDRNVEGYIRRQKSAEGKICIGLRALILEMFPGIREEMRMGVPWYGGRFYVAAFKDHVNLGFSVEGLPEKELGLFEGKGKYMRHITLFPGKGMDRERIGMLLEIAKKSKCYCP